MTYYFSFYLYSYRKIVFSRSFLSVETFVVWKWKFPFEKPADEIKVWRSVYFSAATGCGCRSSEEGLERWKGWLMLTRLLLSPLIRYSIYHLCSLYNISNRVYSNLYAFNSVNCKFRFKRNPECIRIVHFRYWKWPSPFESKHFLPMLDYVCAIGRYVNINERKRQCKLTLYSISGVTSFTIKLQNFF